MPPVAPPLSAVIITSGDAQSLTAAVTAAAGCCSECLVLCSDELQKALEILAAGERIRLRQLPLRAVYAFLKSYLFKGGFRDGADGLVIALSRPIDAVLARAMILDGEVRCAPERFAQRRGDLPDEGTEPPHIHVRCADGECKFRLDTVALARNRDLPARTVRDIERSVYEHVELPLESCDERHPPGNRSCGDQSLE